MEVDGAQSMPAGDVAELANLLAHYAALCRAVIEMMDARERGCYIVGGPDDTEPLFLPGPPPNIAAAAAVTGLTPPPNTDPEDDGA
jgi:hypothetical protein